MPAIKVFGRKWKFASDDFVYPVLFELLFRVLCWITILILFCYHMGSFHLQVKDYLFIYLVGMLAVLGVTIICLGTMAFISAQGNIKLTVQPRNSIPALVYLRTFLYIPELTLVGLGAFWVFEESEEWGFITLALVNGSIHLSWMILFFTVLGVILIFDPLGGYGPKYLGGSQNKSGGGMLGKIQGRARPWADWVWEFRLKFAFCCLRSDRKKCSGAFCKIARLFSDFFTDKWVPSDIAAGLVLLYLDKKEKKRKMKEITAGVADVEMAPLVSGEPTVSVHTESNGRKLEEELKNAQEYAKFARVAYELHSGAGCCGGGSCCRSRQFSRKNLLIEEVFGEKNENLIYQNACNEVYETPYFVARGKKAIVVAVRGTAALSDFITNLSLESHELRVGGDEKTYYSHEGMYEAAEKISAQLKGEKILEEALSKHPDHKLIITGHSLGAGTATLLGKMLLEHYPELKVYAYSPPGGLVSEELAEACKAFVVSIILGKDLVPRLRLGNMEKLKIDVNNILETCETPKYKIFLEGLIKFRKSTEEIQQTTVAEEEGMETQEKKVELYLPGAIIHLTKDRSKKSHFCSDDEYVARWADKREFMDFLIAPGMILNHKLDNVSEALDKCKQMKKDCQRSPSACPV